MRLMQVTCALSLIGFFCGCGESSNTQPIAGFALSGDSNATPVATEVPLLVQNCTGLAAEIVKFDQDDETGRLAESAVLDIAKRSQTCRDQAIIQLIEIVESENEKVIHDPKRLHRWNTTVDTLGELGAKEAVVPLAQRLTVNGGTYAMGLGVYPAASALVKLGDISLSALVAIACTSTSDIQLEQSLNAIYAIHTPAALRALEQIRKNATNAWARKRAVELVSAMKHPASRTKNVEQD